MKLQRILDDDELPLFTGNNGNVGLCLAMNDKLLLITLMTL